MSADQAIRVALEIIGGLVIIILLILRYLLPKRNNPGLNAKPITCKPGHGEMCQQHDRDIVDLKRCFAFVQEEMKEIKLSMNTNFEKLYGLVGEIKNARRSRSKR